MVFPQNFLSLLLHFSTGYVNLSRNDSSGLILDVWIDDARRFGNQRSGCSICRTRMFGFRSRWLVLMNDIKLPPEDCSRLRISWIQD